MLDEHMPAAHRAHKQWTPERLIHWAGEIGTNTGQFVTQLLQRFRHPEHGYRGCLGLLSLAKRYGPQRVEAACTLALELGAGQYRHVRDILANGATCKCRRKQIATTIAVNAGSWKQPHLFQDVEFCI